MKKRYVYALLWGIPGFFVSGIISVVAAGASLGILWIYVFGDNPWPVSAETTVGVVLVLAFFVLWIASITIGYILGKRLEGDPTMNKTHLLISGGLTLLLILFLLLQQWSVGNLGPKSDSVLCSDFCVQKGYAGSGMPPQNTGDRTCSCYDVSGNEALKVPVDDIDTATSR